MQGIEKSFLDEIANKIPGVRGYRDKDARRDSDKRLRDHVAAELDRQRREMDGLKRVLLTRGKLGLLADTDRVAGKMQKAADMLRFASYGYAGLFDQVKIREAELDTLYQHDLQLFREVTALRERVESVAGTDEIEQAVSALESAIDSLLNNIEQRKQLFSLPS